MGKGESHVIDPTDAEVHPVARGEVSALERKIRPEAGKIE
jgi:hypothetical protein